MAEKSKNWTKALFVGLWTALNFCRKLFFNVVFLVIIIGIIAVASREESVPQVTPGSARKIVCRKGHSQRAWLYRLADVQR